eukprot:CAMPEP_0201493016 /NCGR_PEP_ID=MMETSP0151_2-20130828/35757_1 /ASSEMBLY_ACC=CAM_ASM_000257 /TAXON_ID=200890 /ORGANISM="Paramoeba atlantica, Strain 621/1 / CCAP 1560/9" /LENGTH=233 /DNA_ID=CAMNT_0047880141 /DNA_START=100 /DNA_END=801 /DNA_ORIENTATION=+
MEKKKNKGGVVEGEEWEKVLKEVKVKPEEMKRLVMNYLVVEGFSDAASLFSADASIPLPDAPLLEERSKIIEALNAGRSLEATQLVNQSNPEILERNEELTFKLHLQRLVELIGQEKIDDALEFAHEEMAPRCQSNPDYLSDLEKAMTMLAFPDLLQKGEKGEENSSLRYLLDASHRHNTASEVNCSLLQYHGFESESQLSKLIKMLLSLQTFSQKKKISVPLIKDISTASFK